MRVCPHISPLVSCIVRCQMILLCSVSDVFMLSEGYQKKKKKTPPSWQWQLPPYRIANTLDWLDSLLEWANVHTRIYRVPAKADDVSSGESANTGGVLDVSCDRKVSRQHLNQARQNVKRWISIFCVNLSLVPNQLRWLMCIERISKISLNNIEFKKLEL